jgi:tripartite-type tricarboxylate transporter receptor subunit TctC
MKLPRRKFLQLAIGSAALPVAPRAARAQAYPTRPVKLIVGFGPASAADVTARILAQRLDQTLGQQFVVENRPGAASSIGAEYVARARNDGYTLLLATVANAVNVTLSRDLNFDFAKDLAPIALVATLPNILVVHPSLGVKSVQELITLAKSKPGQLSYASAGVGTSTHLSAELFNMMAGVKIVHIPYQGSPQAVTDLLAGRTAMMFSPVSTALPHVAAGKLVALASTQSKRSSAAPDLPTLAELGFKDFDTGIWFGLMAPAGTPPEIINTLNRAANDALASDQVRAALRQQGIDALGGSPEEFANYIRTEIRKWADVAAAAGLTANKGHGSGG